MDSEGSGNEPSGGCLIAAVVIGLLILIAVGAYVVEAIGNR
jgi:hypothetical protein